MDKSKFLGKLTFGFRNFMPYDDFNIFKEKMLEFLKANKDLPDSEFLDKLEKEFPLIRFYDQAITRHYLSKISKSVGILATLAIITIILSVIGGLILLGGTL